MSSSIIIGITGPTGAGKSSLSAEICKRYDFAIIDADEVARKAIENSKECLEKIKAEFGKDVVTQDNRINRKILADRAFESKETTQNLNDITYPYIKREIIKLINQLKHQSKNIIIDAALLFETKIDLYCNYTVAITAPVDIRIKRIIERDKLNFDSVMKRVKIQQDDDFYIKRANYVLESLSSLDKLYIDFFDLLERIKA